MAPQSPEPMLATADVAAMLGVTPTTVLRYVRTKRLDAHKISRRLIRFKRSDVEAFIAEQDEEHRRRDEERRRRRRSEDEHGEA